MVYAPGHHVLFRQPTANSGKCVHLYSRLYWEPENYHADGDNDTTVSVSDSCRGAMRFTPEPTTDVARGTGSIKREKAQKHYGKRQVNAGVCGTGRRSLAGLRIGIASSSSQSARRSAL